MAMPCGYDRLRFVKPVFIGDTLHVLVTLKEKRESPKRPDYGIVVELLETLNQRKEVVMACEHLLMVKKKVKASAQEPESIRRGG